MELRVTHIRGQIGINTHNSVLTIRQPKAVLDITRRPAELNTSVKHVRIKIDQTQCFNESGLKTMLALTDEFAQRGRAAAIEGIGSIVDEGNRMAMIENKADVIAEIAADKAFPPPADFNIALMPLSRPKIEVEGGVSFEPDMGRLEINALVNPPEFSATRPWVDVFLLQKPYFRFEFVGNKVDISV